MEQIFEIETDRLILNRPTHEDLDDLLFQINSCEDYSKNLFNITFPFTAEQAEKWIESCNLGFECGASIRFAIREKEIGKLIGTIGLHLHQEHEKAELGY